VVIDQPRNVAWCGCKRSGRKPYCDGSHARL
jgi:CDGSH-type Zn-finger protein